MGEKTFENIVIIILVVTIIYMLFRKDVELFNNKNYIKKKVTFSDKNDVRTNILSDDIYINDISNNDISNNDISTMQVLEEDVVGVENINQNWAKNYDELNEFVNEYKDYSRFTRGNEGIPKADENAINSYRKSFLDFRHYTNNTTNGFDAVDKIYLERLQQNNSQGLKVADIYDRVTANNYNESNIDVVGMQHNEKLNNMVRSNEFVYNSDTVNNGAFFFNKITGYDNIQYNRSV